MPSSNLENYQALLSIRRLAGRREVILLGAIFLFKHPLPESNSPKDLKGFLHQLGVALNSLSPQLSSKNQLLKPSGLASGPTLCYRCHAEALLKTGRILTKMFLPFVF